MNVLLLLLGIANSVDLELGLGPQNNSLTVVNWRVRERA